jgi:Histidine kinase-, DNA gyrase B-, and HSP90-like ATPase
VAQAEGEEFTMKRHQCRREATPVAHMILSKRMADHKPHDMICELVDNAFDADAKRVWIELARRGVTVGYDGSGMEDIDDAVRFGKGTRVRIHGEAPGIHVEKLRRLLTERYTPGIWQGREIYLRRETQAGS